VLVNLERSLALLHEAVVLGRIARQKYLAECDHVAPQNRNSQGGDMPLVAGIAKLPRLGGMALVSSSVSAAQQRSEILLVKMASLHSSVDDVLLDIAPAVAESDSSLQFRFYQRKHVARLEDIVP
jgi:hypothetical protein